MRWCNIVCMCYQPALFLSMCVTKLDVLIAIVCMHECGLILFSFRFYFFFNVWGFSLRNAMHVQKCNFLGLPSTFILHIHARFSSLPFHFPWCVYVCRIHVAWVFFFLSEGTAHHSFLFSFHFISFLLIFSFFHITVFFLKKVEYSTPPVSLKLEHP